MIQDLISFLNNSPCNFLAVKTIRGLLDNAGFTMLDQREKWNLVPGGKYYVVQNGSAIFPFIVGTKGIEQGFKIVSAHSDSPGFRIKPNPEMLTEGGVLKLNTEVYGGPILYTWFDRPLSICGRVILRSDNPLFPRTKLIKIDRPVLTIPHLAIHYNRAVNEGNPLSKQKDMLPVLAILKEQAEKDNYVLNLVANELGEKPEDILDFDLALYDTTPAMTVGVNNEFITSGRLDDLEMAHAAIVSLLGSENTSTTRIAAIFDNEETGSGTKQGADSPILTNILRRINEALGGNEESYARAIASSFMISADNAHALHPNYPEKQDPTNHPVLGGGPVIKINANCKYMTDADSAAVFHSICDRANVPCQYFVNHSDVAGGSTLGNKLTAQVPLRGVDMGAPQWAMHSCRETAAVIDHEYIVRAFTEFYNI